MPQPVSPAQPVDDYEAAMAALDGGGQAAPVSYEEAMAALDTPQKLTRVDGVVGSNYTIQGLPGQGRVGLGDPGYAEAEDFNRRFRDPRQQAPQTFNTPQDTLRGLGQAIQSPLKTAAGVSDQIGSGMIVRPLQRIGTNIADLFGIDPEGVSQNRAALAADAAQSQRDATASPATAFGQAYASSAPSAAAMLVTRGRAAPLAQAAAFGTLGLGAAEGGMASYEDQATAKGEKVSPGKSLAIGAAYAATEAIFEKVGIDSTGAIAKRAGNQIADAILSKNVAGLSKILVDVGMAGAVNATEEGVTQIAQNIIDRAAYDPERDLTEGVADAAYQGAVQGIALGGGGAAIQAGARAIEGKQRANRLAEIKDRRAFRDAGQAITAEMRTSPNTVSEGEGISGPTETPGQKAVRDALAWGDSESRTRAIQLRNAELAAQREDAGRQAEAQAVEAAKLEEQTRPEPQPEPPAVKPPATTEGGTPLVIETREKAKRDGWEQSKYRDLRGDFDTVYALVDEGNKATNDPQEYAIIKAVAGQFGIVSRPRETGNVNTQAVSVAGGQGESTVSAEPAGVVQRIEAPVTFDPADDDATLRSKFEQHQRSRSKDPTLTVELVEATGDPVVDQIIKTGRRFGSRIVVVKSNRPGVVPGLNVRGGGAIVLDAGSEGILPKIMAHETLHTLQQQAENGDPGAQTTLDGIRKALGTERIASGLSKYQRLREVNGLPPVEGAQAVREGESSAMEELLKGPPAKGIRERAVHRLLRDRFRTEGPDFIGRLKNLLAEAMNRLGLLDKTSHKRVLDAVDAWARYAKNAGAAAGVAKAGADESLTGTPEFKRWFGKSKAVDKSGNPLVLFRGDRTGKRQFDGPNVFATDHMSVAAFYGNRDGKSRRAVVDRDETDGLYRVYVSLQNPLVIDAKGESWMDIPMGDGVVSTDTVAEEARRLGHDGVILRNVRDQTGAVQTEYIALSPAQIKSATGNKGAFDPKSPRIDEALRSRVDKPEEIDTTTAVLGGRYGSWVTPDGKVYDVPHQSHWEVAKKLAKVYGLKESKNAHLSSEDRWRIPALNAGFVRVIKLGRRLTMQTRGLTEQNLPVVMRMAKLAVDTNQEFLLDDIKSGATVMARMGETPSALMTRLRAMAQPDIDESLAEPDDEATAAALKKAIDQTPPGEERVRGGIDERGIDVLRANLYQGNIGDVVAKELLQNAIDATRDVDIPGGARVALSVNTIFRTVQITDNGSGMTPDILRKEFMDIGGSKKPDGASGGFGIAKVAILGNAADNKAPAKDMPGIEGLAAEQDMPIFVSSVAKVGDGKVRSTMTGFGKDWFGEGFKLVTQPVTLDTPTGTEIFIRLRDDAKLDSYATKGKMMSYLNDALLPDLTLDLTLDTVKLERGMSGWSNLVANDRVASPTPVGTLDLPQAKVNIHASVATRKQSYLGYTVLNNGMPQFTDHLRIASDEAVPLPEHVLINVRATVQTTADDYPFSASREALKASVREAINDWLQKNLVGSVIASQKDKYRNLLNEAAHIQGVKARTAKIVRTDEMVSAELVAALAGRPYAKELYKALTPIFNEIGAALAKRFDNEAMTRFDFYGFAPADRFYGVNVSAKALGGTNNAILMNPWNTWIAAKDAVYGGRAEEGQTVAQVAAADMVATAIHEVVHQASWNHNSDYAGNLTRAVALLGPRSGKWANKIARIMALAQEALDADARQLSLEWGGANALGDAGSEYAAGDDAGQRDQDSAGASGDSSDDALAGPERGDDVRAGAGKARRVSPVSAARKGPVGEVSRARNFKRWFAGSKIVDEDGAPLAVFHGTTHDFRAFNRQKGNPEGDWGRGFYFSNEPEDVGHNYAGVGPDLQMKIEARAEAIENELVNALIDAGKTPPNYGDPAAKRMRAKAMKQAKAELVGHGGATMKVHLAIKNPLVIGGDGDMFLAAEYEYEDPNDPESDIKGVAGPAVKLLQAVEEQGYRYDIDRVGDSGTGSLLEGVVSDGGAWASDLVKSLKESEILSLYDDEGRHVGSEVLRAAIEDAGYDGIIDHTVDIKFGSQSKRGLMGTGGMKGMDPDTVHYIAFRPEQVKSATGNRGTFSAKSPNIDEALTHTPEFKAWFGKSKVTEGGQPKVMYHASTYGGDFRAFDKAEQRKGLAGFGFYFSDAEGANVYATHSERFKMPFSFDGKKKATSVLPVYLKMERPLRVGDLSEMPAKYTQEGRFGTSREVSKIGPEALTAIQRDGYDGVMGFEFVKWNKDGSLHIVSAGTPGAIMHPVAVVFEPTQIKSALGNRGTFDPTSPNIDEGLAHPEELANKIIAASFGRGIKAPVVALSGRLVARLAAGKAGPAIDAMRGVVRKAGLETVPDRLLVPEWVAARRTAELEARYGKALGAAHGALLHYGGSSKMLGFEIDKKWVADAANRRLMNEVLLGDAPITALPAEYQPVAASIRKELDDLGQQAVNAGYLTQDTYDRLKGKYLPRLYVERELDKRGLRGAVARLRMNNERRQPRLSDAFAVVDKDGEPIDGPSGSFRFASAIDRDQFLDGLIQTNTVAEVNRAIRGSGQSINLTDLAPINLGRLSQPLQQLVKTTRSEVSARYARNDPKTDAELDAMGLIREAAYPVATAMIQLRHDLALLKFYQAMATNPATSSKTETAYFNRQVPTTPKYGALSGHWLPEELHRDLANLHNTPGIALETYRTLMNAWKFGKTVLNPATWGRNLLGNLQFADFAGVGLHDPRSWPHYVTGIRNLAGKNGPDIVREMQRQGVIGTEFNTAELGNVLDELGATLNTNPSPAEWLWQVTKGLMGKAADGYGLIDQIFKAASYAQQRAAGIPPEAAAEHVKAWFPDYSRVPRTATVKGVRDVIFPFFSFYYEALRINAKAAKEKPLTLAKWAALPYLLTQLSYGLLGADDDDREKIAEELKGGGVFSILLPFRDAKGRLIQWDLSNIVPTAGVTGLRAEANPMEDKTFAESLLNGLITSNPLLNAAVTFGTNRDPFTKRQLFQTGMTPGEKAGAAASQLWRTAQPGFMGAIEQNIRATKTQRGTLDKRDATTVAIRTLVGVDVKSADPQPRRMIDAFIKRHERPVGADASGDTTPRQRAAGELYQALLDNDQKGFDRALRLLNAVGAPVKNSGSLMETIRSRHPLARLRVADRPLFMRELTTEERRVIEAATAEYRLLEPRARALYADHQP